MDFDSLAIKVGMTIDGLDEAAGKINGFMRQMKNASASVTAVIQENAATQLDVMQTASKEETEAAKKAADQMCSGERGCFW